MEELSNHLKEYILQPEAKGNYNLGGLITDLPSFKPKINKWTTAIRE